MLTEHFIILILTITQAITIIIYLIYLHQPHFFQTKVRLRSKRSKSQGTGSNLGHEHEQLSKHFFIFDYPYLHGNFRNN